MCLTKGHQYQNQYSFENLIHTLSKLKKDWADCITLTNTNFACKETRTMRVTNSYAHFIIPIHWFYNVEKQPIYIQPKKLIKRVCHHTLSYVLLKSKKQIYNGDLDFLTYLSARVVNIDMWSTVLLPFWNPICVLSMTWLSFANDSSLFVKTILTLFRVYC